MPLTPSNEYEKRSSFPPFEPDPPSREKQGYTLFPTGDVYHSRSSSTGHGLYYQAKDTHPYRGKMQRDYDVYKTANSAFEAASTRLNDTKTLWKPPTGANKPTDMATYGEGQCYTPAGHQALIQPTAVASGYAYQAHAGRQAFVEEHVGRGYKDYDDFKDHRDQTLGLRNSYRRLSRQQAQHIMYSTSPERPASYAESSKGSRP